MIDVFSSVKQFLKAYTDTPILARSALEAADSMYDQTARYMYRSHPYQWVTNQKKDLRGISLHIRYWALVGFVVCVLFVFVLFV